MSCFCLCVCVCMCVQSPNGRLIASGAIDGIINLFDLQTGKLLHTLEGKHEWLSLGLSATLCIYLVMVLRYTEIYAALETYNIQYSSIKSCHYPVLIIDHKAPYRVLPHSTGF